MSGAGFADALFDRPSVLPSVQVDDPRLLGVIVYLHPDGISYVADLGSEEACWYRWPAMAHGWQARQRCSATLADDCEEAEPELARLALLLSGVDLGDIA